MATLTTAETPPWCQPIKHCIATPSLSQGESFALKVDTRGNNSQKNNTPTVLREIPTRISPLPPTAAVVDRHDDDIERTQHATRPSFPTTPTVPTSVSVSKNDADNYVDRTLEKIEKLMRRWPSPQIDGAPRNTGLALSHSTSPPPPPINPLDHEPYDQESNLDRIDAKVEQMRRRWPSTSAVKPTATTDPRTNMNEWSARCNSPSLHTMETNFPNTPVTLATTMQVTANPAPFTKTNFVPLAHRRTTAGNDSDLPLLAAVKSLDHFLMKYPRPQASDAPYQPSPDRRQLPSSPDRLAQQTQVLCTMNVLLGEISNKLSQFIDALSGIKKHTKDMSPKLLPRTPCVLANAATRLPPTTVCTSKHSIPAKPPFSHLHRNLTLPRTKENLCPP